MHYMPDDAPSGPVAHDGAWWKFAFKEFMRGPNSIYVIGGILLVGATGGGVVRILDGELGPGLLFLGIGVVGLTALLKHLDRMLTALYVEHRRGEALHRRSASDE